MMKTYINTATPEDKEEIITLWQMIFQDAQNFVDLFFSRVYKPENTLVVKATRLFQRNEGGKARIIAALQMVPYQIKCGYNILSAAYICGVCTHPAERNKGIMKALMTEAMEVMRRRGYVVSLVIPAEPWLFDFYKKFGFTLSVNERILRYTLLAREDLQSVSFHECTSEHFYYFDRKQQERLRAVLHHAHDYATILQDLRAEGGNAYIMFKENEPVGMAFVAKIADNSLIIKELFYETAADMTILANHILRLYSSTCLSIRFPPNEDHHSEIHPYGLACLLDPSSNDDLSDLYMTLMLD